MSDSQNQTTAAIEEGGPCPEDCGGELAFRRDGDCYCHISPPCSACVDPLLSCPECGWEQERPAPSEIQKSAAPIERWWEMPRPSHDLGNGKRVFDYDYDSSSGSTMVFKGRYEGDVTPADIIALLGDGTFGHRGPTMCGGRFTYTKITD